MTAVDALPDAAFLADGGETGALIAAHDWGATPLGRIAAWPQSLRTATAILLRSPVPMVMLWGAEGVMLYNDAYSVFAGNRHPALLGSKVREGWPEVADFNDHVMKVGLAGGTLAYKDQELTLYRTGRAEQVWMNLDYSPVLDEAGRPAGVLAVVIETTERVRAARELRKERDRSQGVLDNMGEAFVLLDRDYRIVDMNAEALRLESRPREEVVGKTHWEAHPDASRALTDLYRIAMTERRSVALEHRYVWPDGRDTWIDMRAYPVVDGLAVFYRDITERKRADAVVAESEARFRNMADHAPVMMWVTDPSGSCTYLNRRWYEFTGQADREGEGDGWLRAVHPDDRALAQGAFRSANAEERDYRVEFRIRRADGAYRWAIDAAAARFGEGGAFLGYVGSVIDIDDLREAELALRASTAQAEALAAEQAAILGQLAEGVIVTDPKGRITFVNDAAARLHGVSRLDVDPDGYSETYHLLTVDGDPYPSHELPLARAVLNAETVANAPWRIRRPDGSEVLAVGSARPVIAPSGARIGAVLTLRDESERAEAERALRDSRDRLAEESRALEVLNRTGTMVAAELNLEHLVQQVVDAGVTLTGARFGAFFYNVLDQTGASYMLYALSGAERSAFDGFGMPRATSVFAPTFRGERVIRSDDILKDERYGKNAPHAGMPKGHLPVRSYLAVPVTSRSGEVIGGLFFGHDRPGIFTERAERAMTGLAAQAAIGIDNARLFDAVQRSNAELEARVRERTAELETAHEALRQSQKMEAVGQLTGGIAHDFNNMLAVVIGSLDLLGRRIGGGDARAKRYVDAASDGARRAALLTQRLLAFSRQQPLKPEPIDANKLVAGMSELIRGSLGGEVRLEAVLASGLWRTHADPNQLENVILNLAVNARDAMPHGGRLTIETQNAHLDARYVAAHLGVAPGQYVLIAVTDTGHGMAEEVIAKAFDPFFTTKEVGKGTGLGLSQVYGFVKQSGGHVKIYSELGQGTTVKVYLPRLIGADGSVADERDAGEMPMGDAQEAVLVVEDEPAVRQFSVDALTELGYRVLEADSAANALRLLEAHPEIALMFTDVVMPEVNGAKLAKEARRLRPDLPILFTTGYTRNAVVHNGVLDPGVELIGKPFSIEELAAKVREVLDAPVTERKG